MPACWDSLELLEIEETFQPSQKPHGQNWTYLLRVIKQVLSSVQSLSCVQLFATAWTITRQASLFIANSRSLLKLMSIKLVMPSNHLMLCRPLLLPPIFPNIRVFSNESVLHIRWECALGLAVVQSIKRTIRFTGWVSKDYRGPPLCWLVFWHQCHVNHLQLFLLKHPFVKSAKGVSILRDLINEAMDVKLKRQEAQQREVDQDEDENSVSAGVVVGLRH